MARPASGLERDIPMTAEDRELASSWLSVAAAALGAERFLSCCNVRDELSGSGELKVLHLSSDVMDNDPYEPEVVLQQHPFDTAGAAKTPRQHAFEDRIRLPKLLHYPLPPGCLPEETEDRRHETLLQIFKEFVMNLHEGMHMTQLSASQDRSEIHCQILEDLQTLKVDYGTGSLIEFPLSNVSKVYRMAKHEGNLLTGSEDTIAPGLSKSEHIVVVEFVRRKLAFVFADMVAAQRFLMCLELLIRRAHETREESRANGATADAQDDLIPTCAPVSKRTQSRRRGRSLFQEQPEETPEENCACQAVTAKAELL